MKYYKLLYDYKNDKDFICCDKDELYEIDEYDVQKGKIIKNWNDKNTLFYCPTEGNKETDYLGNHLGWLIVSKKFKDIFNKINNEIQFLPINIVNKKDKSELSCYYLVNIIKKIDALDLKNSKYEEFELDENEKVLSIELFALKEKKIKGENIFRLKEYEEPIFISEIIKNEISNNELIGFDFLEVKVS